MKPPEELSRRFARQWESADLREERLLGGAESWPISLPIGRPPPSVFSSDLDSVKRHVDRWRSVRVGKVVWETTSYRAAAEPVEYPARWQVDNLAEWVTAAADRRVRKESETLRALITASRPEFHSMFARQRSLWRVRELEETVQAVRLASALEPGCAEGKPLRSISLEGIDTKFFERNERLILALLDLRFDGEVSRLGLANFLGAPDESDHWLLVADLDGGLLPFRKQRVPSFELRSASPAGQRVILVENESSLHQLPRLPGTLAILGAGFDLTWTEAGWLREKDVAYWGDIDTWGLQFLAKARVGIPGLTALLMTMDVFQAHRDLTVREPVHAIEPAEGALGREERQLFKHLLREKTGRLEQEFLPIPLVREEILRWATATE